VKIDYKWGVRIQLKHKIILSQVEPVGLMKNLIKRARNTLLFEPRSFRIWVVKIDNRQNLERAGRELKVFIGRKHFFISPILL
jgi:hypothetical protein